MNKEAAQTEVLDLTLQFKDAVYAEIDPDTHDLTIEETIRKMHTHYIAHALASVQIMQLIISLTVKSEADALDQVEFHCKAFNKLLRDCVMEDITGTLNRKRNTS